MSIDYVVSVDVAGEKAIAGPLVASALILDARIAPLRFSWPSTSGHRVIQLRDLDTVPPDRRAQIADAIRTSAAGFSTVVCTPSQINEGKPRELRAVAMGRALVRAVEHAMFRNPRFRLHIDRTRILAAGGGAIPSVYAGQGLQELHRDAKDRPWQLEAAYAIARAYREGLMQEVSVVHPEYDFSANTGHASPEHRRALEVYGVTPYHRQRSNLVREVSGARMAVP